MASSTSTPWFTIHASAASLPAPSTPTAAEGGDITSLQIGGLGGDTLVCRLTASGGAVTVTNVRIWRREDGEWGRLANAGGDDVALATAVIADGFSTEFVIGPPSRADRLLFEIDTIAGGTIAASVKRLDFT